MFGYVEPQHRILHTKLSLWSVSQAQNPPSGSHNDSYMFPIVFFSWFIRPIAVDRFCIFSDKSHIDVKRICLPVALCS